MTQRDKFLNGCELIDPLDRDRLHRAGSAKGGDVVGQAMSFVQHNEGLLVNFFDGHVFRCRQWMPLRNDEQEFFVEEPFDFQILRDDWKGEDREIDFAVAAPFDQIVGGVLLDDHGDLRVLFPEISQQGGQKVGGYRGNGSQANATMTRCLGQFRASVFDELEDFPGSFVEEFPEISQHHFAGLSFKQWLTELVFQLLDRAAQGGLGKIQFPGRPGKVACTCYRDKLFELLEIELIFHTGNISMLQTRSKSKGDTVNARRVLQQRSIC